VASSDPVYLRVVEDLRRQILDSTLPPGAPIPSRVQLTQRYGVGETAARHALRVLAQEGLIVGRVGAGHYVRERPVLSPLRRSRSADPPALFAADMQAHGRSATWDWRSEMVEATPDIARRLRIDAAEPVLRTAYVLRGDGRPLQLVTCYEPAEFGEGLPLPQEGTGPHATPASRTAAAGVTITAASEDVYLRVPRPDESDRLELPTGTQVLHLERTHWSGDRPVETSDIVVPGDKFRLSYTIPLPGA
jgi:GntR family transcriptional regulator